MTSLIQKSSWLHLDIALQQVPYLNSDWLRDDQVAITVCPQFKYTVCTVRSGFETPLMNYRI